MKIEAFSELLSRVLHGDWRALDEWDVLRVHFEPHQIDQALLEINALLSQPDHPQRSHALYLRAYMYERGLGCIVNYSEAISFYEQAIVLKNPAAMNGRALMYQCGIGGDANIAAAVDLFKQAMALDFPSSINNLAWLYERGIDDILPVNVSEAITLYQQAINLGHAIAMNNLAMMIQHGVGCAVDMPAAIALYKQSIELNCPVAMSNLAKIYGLGAVNVPVDYKAAIELYDQSIALGFPGAMCDRAQMLQHGVGGRVDHAGAIELYKQAIVLNYPPAMFHLAELYENDRDVPGNYLKAIELYKQATEFHFPPAFYNLGKMLEKGLGCKVNYHEAVRYYNKAAQLGHQGAKDIDLVALERHAEAQQDKHEETIEEDNIIALYRKEPTIGDLFYSIQSMKEHGKKLVRAEADEKGRMVIMLANDLERELKTFLVSSHKQAPTQDSLDRFKIKFSGLLDAKEPQMEEHREIWKPIVINILIALSVIGLFALLRHVYQQKEPRKFNDAFFFAKTRSQQCGEDVVEFLDELSIKSLQLGA